MFLLTDKENKTFGNFYWDVEKENETDNPNHYFRLYNSLEAALYLAPFFGHSEFNVWEAQGSGECIEERASKRFSKVKTTALVEGYLKPSDEKRTIAAILCSLNLVKNQHFLDWCLTYLNKGDNFKEQAFVLRESISDTEEESEYFGCAVPLLSCLSKQEKLEELTAASIFRSISDSVDINDPIDLGKVIKIASVVPPEEIAAIIK